MKVEILIEVWNEDNKILGSVQTEIPITPGETFNVNLLVDAAQRAVATAIETLKKPLEKLDNG